MLQQVAEICTLVLLLDVDPVEGECLWLGIKKLKQGAGRPNAPGGKLDPKDQGCVRQCAVREVKEETGIRIWSAELGQKRAIWHFYQAGVLIFHCHVYIVTRPSDAWNCNLTWKKKPRKTKQMGPWKKYPLNKIPYRRMLAADKELFEGVLDGRVFQAWVYYDADLKHLEKKVRYERFSAE